MGMQSRACRPLRPSSTLKSTNGNGPKSEKCKGDNVDGCVVVTGAGRGIGRAICRKFGSTGANVVAASRSTGELGETRTEVEDLGGSCLIRPTDVSRPAEVEALVANAVKHFGYVDALVNCAGVAVSAPMGELSGDDFDRIWQVNMAAVYHACRAVWPGMRMRQSGAIINISSVAAEDPLPGLTVYGASKAWVNALTRALAREGRPLGIAAFAVGPGAVETTMLRDALPDFPKEQALDPMVIAELVYSLTLPSWKYASGQVFYAKKT